MHVFTRVVDSNSFSGAADGLDMTRSSVTTIVQNLEAYLKVRLLNRTTRRISLTPDGAAYYDRCSRILATLRLRKLIFQYRCAARKAQSGTAGVARQADGRPRDQRVPRAIP